MAGQKIIAADPDLLLRLFTQDPGSLWWHFPVAENLPKTFRVLGVYYDYAANRLDFKVESDEWPEPAYEGLLLEREPLRLRDVPVKRDQPA
jgi:hypothetical protein